MNHSDVLATLAEVSAAFVGFSMVAGLLRPTSLDAKRRFYAIRDVAEIGLVVVGGSLAPLALQLFSLFSLSDAALWRLCSFILSILNIRDRNRVWGSIAIVLNGIGQVLLWWNVISPTGATSARYVSAPMILLSLAATLFVSAVFSERDDEFRCITRC